MRWSLGVLIPAVFLASCASPRVRWDVDPQIASVIERTRAIDNHAHPNVSDADHDYDVLPVDLMQPSPMPPRLDPGNPEWKSGKKVSGGPSEILDAAGIDIMLANRIAMAPGLDPNRFKWVPYIDAFLYPLNNSDLAARDPDRKVFFTAEEKMLKRYLGDTPLPPGYDAYLALVTKTLESHKSQGAVAEKFEMAYLRSLAVGAGNPTEAGRIYTSLIKGGVPSEAEYKTFQDTVFRHIAAECGRLGLAGHIHSFAGAGGHFDVAGANPLGLEPVFNDPAMRKTQFVIIHGGWPYAKQTQALLLKPNVYADISLLGLILYAHPMSEALRGWLEWAPDRVLFGTDSGPFGPGVGLSETAQLSAKTVRVALGLALTAMVRDGEITYDRAGEIARMVLRDNARRLYGWK